MSDDKNIVRHKMLLGGQWVEGNMRDILSPYDSRVVGRAGFGTKKEVESAIDSAYLAKEALFSLSAAERSHILHKTAEIIKGRQEEFAQTICGEAGKPIRLARSEVARACETFIVSAEEAKRLKDEAIIIDSAEGVKGRYGILRHFPIGVVSAITPFNFPLNLVAHKVAPAISAGCPVVLKPASKTPLSSLMLGEAMVEAGVPKGALSVVPADAKNAEPMITDSRVRLITFTGSAQVGWGIKKQAFDKRVVLELGGNAAVIVADDADFNKAIPRLALGAFAYSGQVCISVQRIYVFKRRYDEFLEKFVSETKNNVKFGDPKNESVIAGPMIDADNASRVMEWLAEASSAGAKIHTGGVRDGNLVEPTVVSDVPHSAKVVSEEVFGPVVVVEAIEGIDEAIARVNESKYGLQAGIYTNRVDCLWQAFERVEVGGVIHNDYPTFRVDHMPYGGVKGSGTGREGPRYAIEEMCEKRLLVLSP